MKPLPVLLASSLLANVALVAVIAVRRPPAPDHSAPPAKGAENSVARIPASAEALRAAIASGDAAALEAAGVPAPFAREFAVGRMFSRMAEKVRASKSAPSTDNRWWRVRSGAAAPGAREQQLVARRELSDALIAAFGDDLGLAGNDNTPYAFLDSAKRDALRRIVQDYDEMMAKFSAGGVQLASDREKLRLLRLERDRDIASLLTPEERDAYEMRTSTSGNIVKNRYGDAIETEAEFQKIYALQKAFDERFPREALTGRISPEVLRARSEAERQLDADLRAAVGEDRYAALRRAADPDFRTLDALASRLNLPATSTDQVLAARESYSTASQKIANDPNLSPPDRRTQIQALGAQAKSDLVRSLGGEAADAYAQRSPWISMLQSGMAYSTTPPDGAPGALLSGSNVSVHPVMPAGATMGGQRQFMISTASTSDAAIVNDAVGGGNIQVMSFSSGATTDSAASPGGLPTVRRIINGSPESGTPAAPPGPGP